MNYSAFQIRLLHPQAAMIAIIAICVLILLGMWLSGYTEVRTYVNEKGCNVVERVNVFGQTEKTLRVRCP